jgi:pimeloyl-ACP methyl ester carboxylesterase
MQRTTPLLFLLASALGASAAHADAASGDGILWQRCPTDMEAAAAGFAKRLECGVMMVPQDWRQENSERTVPIALVRIRAGAVSKRQGALFFNFGGPALHPGDNLVNMAAEWQSISAADPLEGSKRRIMQQFDVVTVVPRGLDDVSALNCPDMDTDRASEYLLEERTTARWNALVTAAHVHADTCGAQPGAGLVNSEQHVRDMDHARVLLGETKFNFFGASYGGWVGALYGTLFPANVGRMVFDSSVDASSSMERFQLLRPQWRERDLTRLATIPAAKVPGFWGLGSDSKAIRTRLQAMPMLLRAYWGPLVKGPENVVAALHVADLYTALPPASRTRANLLKQVADHHFHDKIDQTVRKSATQLVQGLEVNANGTFRPGWYGWPNATLATYCNDGRWNAKPAGVRAALGQHSEFSTFDEGDSSLMLLMCSRWPRSDAATPSMEVLRTVPGILMIHSNLDRTTPIKGAELMAAELPNARLVVVDDLASHGVITAGGSCATQAAGEYLLTGILPVAMRTSCNGGSLMPAQPDPSRSDL